jgi:F0F1-type ATP synthase membrane subunit b/b'
MTKVMKVIAWLKKYGWMVLAAIGAILSALLAIQYEKKKIDKLHGELTVAKVKGDNAIDTGTKEAAKKYEAKLETQDKVIVQNIADTKKEIEDVRKNVEKMSGSEIANGFNSLYSNTSGK